MHWSGVVSLACLVITAGLATWGVFSRHFNDTIGQRIGLSVVAIAFYLRIPIKIENPVTPPEILMAQIGLCIFAGATAWKIWHMNRRHHDRRRTHRH